MRLTEIEKRAKAVGIKDTWKFSRKDLIRIIQQTEGNSVCFGTRKGVCDQAACCWKEDCLR